MEIHRTTEGLNKIEIDYGDYTIYLSSNSIDFILNETTLEAYTPRKFKPNKKSIYNGKKKWTN